MYEYDEFVMNMMNVYNKMNINEYDEYICIRWILEYDNSLWRLLGVFFSTLKCMMSFERKLRDGIIIFCQNWREGNKKQEIREVNHI